MKRDIVQDYELFYDQVKMTFFTAYEFQCKIITETTKLNGNYSETPKYQRSFQLNTIFLDDLFQTGDFRYLKVSDDSPLERILFIDGPILSTMINIWGAILKF